MPDLCAGHALQTSRTARKHARKVGRNRVIKPGDAVGENPGHCGGEPMPSERTEERFERLLNHGGKRPKRMLHGGVPGVSYIYFQIQPQGRPNVLTIENGREYPGSPRWHLPMFYALPVLSPELVQLARLEVYRVNSTHGQRIRETLELCRQARFLKDSVRPQLRPPQAHICRSEVSDFVEGPKIF